MKTATAIAGLTLLLIFVSAALFAPWISPFDPTAYSLPNELCRPNAIHLLGCDSFGADILSILVYGARISLTLGILVTIVNVLIGLCVGSIAGYFGGLYDQLLMRILDVLFAFPGLILAIAIAAVLGPSTWNVGLALVVTGWTGFARIVRGEVLALKEKEYVLAAKNIGAHDSRILLLHVWPNLLPTLVVTASFSVAHVIIAESSLSFLGIGAPIGTPSWGILLSYGREVIIEAPHVALFPGICIALIVLCFNLLGEALRSFLNPKQDL